MAASSPRNDLVKNSRVHPTHWLISTQVKSNQKVIKFLVNCGEPNLQYLLVPARLESALQQLDTDRDGHIDAQEWC